MKVQNKFEFLIKLLLLGDSNVGKTNFLLRFVDNKFIESYMTTVGFDFRSKIVTLPKLGKRVKLQVWDTAGQEKFMSINKNLFLRVQGIMLFYDITNRDIFKNLSIWKNIIREFNSNLPVILIGNKIDLEDMRIVSAKEGREFAEENNMIFIEASGKDDINVNEAFNVLSEKILDNCNLRDSCKEFDDNDNDNDSGNTDDEKNQELSFQKKKNKNNCC